MPASESLVIDPAARRRSIFEFLQSARRSIHLSLFRCDDAAIVYELIRARRRGVDVRVLMTNRAKRSMKQLDELFLVFRREGIPAIRYAGPHERYHAKYALIDRARALVSSMNLTREPFVETDDVLVFTRDRSVVAGLHELFFADQLGRPDFQTASPRLVISPDTARRQLTALIDDAKASLLVVDHKFSDRDVADSLERARQRGVNVQIVDARFRSGRRAHAKLMIVDGRLAVAGSLALCESTLDERRDLAIMIDSPALVRQLLLHLREIKERRCA
jgi:phosphatidylserine/phosphatidylglycerophosphate/cardiolipin synthase-like enzyme